MKLCFGCAAFQGQFLDPDDEAAREDQVQHQRQHRDDQRRAAEAVSQGDEDDARAHLAAGEHADRECEPLAQFPVAVEEDRDQLPDVRERRNGHDVQDQHAPRHHRLRRRDGGGGRGGVCRRSARHERHAHADKQHEQERDARCGAAFGRGVDLPVLHQHADHEGRKQHLDVYAVFRSVPPRGDDVERLRQGADHR